MISGLAYGYLYLATGNLWAPWLAHTLNNPTLNLVHTDTSSGLDAGVGVRNVVIVLGLAVVVLIMRVLAP